MGSLWRNNEFQSAIVRLIAWVVLVILLGLGKMEGYFPFTWEQYFYLFGCHFIWYAGILLHVILRPQHNPLRTYLSALADTSGTSFCIYLNGEVISPFVLIYLWSYISQGTRFGLRNLVVACVASLVCFNVVVIALDGWSSDGFAVSFELICLVILPFYQVALLRKLHDSREVAEAANRAKGHFLAIMTHELRTPLAGIIGMSRLLATTSLDREQRQYLESASTSVNMLESLIGDVLDFSKIDAGKLELTPRLFDLRASVTAICATLTPETVNRGVELVSHIDGEVPVQVYGDELRINQVIYNLLDNAVKFTEHGTVTIQIEVVHEDESIPEGHLRITVRDTGVGISPEKLKRVFESFWQADSSTTRRYEGSGLGTSIARNLVLLMGGNLYVESIEGEGSAFWFNLPLMLGPIKGLTPPRAPEKLHGKTVMLFEPQADSREVLAETCLRAGMQVVSVDAAEVDATMLPSHNGNNIDLVLFADQPIGGGMERDRQRLRGYQSLGLPVIYLTCYSLVKYIILMGQPSAPTRKNLVICDRK
ncbi:MAG: ATP-binding protein, partial [Sedimenticola sp.]